MRLLRAGREPSLPDGAILPPVSHSRAFRMGTRKTGRGRFWLGSAVGTMQPVHFGQGPRGRDFMPRRVGSARMSTKLAGKNSALPAGPLLEKTLRHSEPIAGAGAGSRDGGQCHEVIVGARSVTPPAMNAPVRRHGNTKTASLPRDEARRRVHRCGCEQWKRIPGYHPRSPVETIALRFKRIIGQVPRSSERVVCST